MNGPLFVCPECQVPTYNQGSIHHTEGCEVAEEYRELMVVQGEGEARAIMATRQQRWPGLAQGLVLVDLDDLDADEE